MIRRHLVAPDGARLFDRPLPYRGGFAERFQRAETSSYTSSSDADFPDRYAASARYGEVTTLLGLRLRRATLGLDPVLPRALDGLRARVALAGRQVDLTYRVGALGYGPKALELNGSPLPFVREAHPYREGGAVIAMDLLREQLRDARNELVVEVG